MTHAPANIPIPTAPSHERTFMSASKVLGREFDGKGLMGKQSRSSSSTAGEIAENAGIAKESKLKDPQIKRPVFNLDFLPILAFLAIEARTQPEKPLLTASPHRFLTRNRTI
jgi:hypothetical protein